MLIFFESTSNLNLNLIINIYILGCKVPRLKIDTHTVTTNKLLVKQKLKRRHRYLFYLYMTTQRSTLHQLLRESTYKYIFIYLELYPTRHDNDGQAPTLDRSPTSNNTSRCFLDEKQITLTTNQQKLKSRRYLFYFYLYMTTQRSTLHQLLRESTYKYITRTLPDKTMMHRSGAYARSVSNLHIYIYIHIY